MIIEKGKKYGRTSEEVREMFPNQFVVIKVLEYKDIYDLANYRKAIVKYFKCEGHFSVDMAEKLEQGDPGSIYFSATTYDPALEGDLLWF